MFCSSENDVYYNYTHNQTRIKGFFLPLSLILVRRVLATHENEHAEIKIHQNIKLSSHSDKMSDVVSILYAGLKGYHVSQNGLKGQCSSLHMYSITLYCVGESQENRGAGSKLPMK